MRYFLPNIPAIIALALLCALAAPTVKAQDAGIPFRWESIEAFVDVQQNGDMLVQVTQDYAFHREYSRYTLANYINMERIDQIDQVSVIVDGRDLPVRTAREGGEFKIRWTHIPPPQTDFTFILRYRVQGGLQLGEEEDGAIWAIRFPGDFQGVPIDRGTVTVRVPPSVSSQIRSAKTLWSADVEWPDSRTVTLNLPETMPDRGALAVAVYFPHGLIAAPIPDWRANVPPPDRVVDIPTHSRISWIFKKTGLIGLFPTWPWARITHYLYWALRLSPIGLFLLLFVVYRIGRRRRPEVEYPEVPEGLTTLPSNLPAPVVSVFDRRAVGPQTYLSILVDLLQKGNLTITGTYDNSRLSRTDQEFHSDVTLTRQFEPDQPWEKEVYDAIDRNRTDAGALLSRLERRKDAISRHLDTHLLSRGIFPGPTPSGTRGTGCLVLSGAFMGAVFVALGVGLWVNFWLLWWAGAAIGILPAAVFFFVALPDPEPHIAPTPAGALEISRWRAFRQSLRNGLVSPSRDPSRPDPLLPYVVALDAAEQWLNNSEAVPAWFLPGGDRERTREGLYAVYRGFIGADSWGLSGGPNVKRFSPATRSHDGDSSEGAG